MKNIDSIIANAQKLMINEDFWSKVESVESSRTTNGGKVKGSCAEVFRNNNDVQQLQTETANRRKKTGNPVLDSFIDKPPMTGEHNPYLLNETFANPQQNTQQPIIQERIVQQPSNTQIDYNYIKYLVEEAVKNALSQNMINESKGNNIMGMKMCEGNKIQFMDSKGNIYEGVLKLKKKRQ